MLLLCLCCFMLWRVVCCDCVGVFVLGIGCDLRLLWCCVGVGVGVCWFRLCFRCVFVLCVVACCCVLC